MLLRGFFFAALLATVASFGLWEEQGRAPDNNDITVHVALKQENTQLLYEKFVAVSTPGNADYGNHWSRDELFNVVRPSEETITAVSAWLQTAGLPFKATAGTAFFEVTARVTDVERLLGIELFHYNHKNFNIIRMRVGDNINLPASVKDHVDTVFGISGFPEPRFLTSGVGAENVTPDILKKLYNLPTAGSGLGSMGLAEFEGQSYSPKDLVKFQKKYGLLQQAIVNTTGANDNFAHMEANLDVQYIMAVGQNIPTDFWLQSHGFNLIKWISDVMAKDDATLVWSISYGEALASIKKEDAQRLDQEFQKIATTGVSIIFASGDSGPYSRQEPRTKFFPTYPASLPSVTAVGATTLTGGEEKESASFSGGGFGMSSYFQRNSTATWQLDAVNAYFSNKNIPMPDASMYDRDGVGFPDVSAQGVNFEVYYHGFLTPVSGTSASAPTFAGAVALLNDQRLKAGKSPMGFLNPFIYANPHAFNDITEGNNFDGTKTGWTTAPGWDPVTGMGTPNYPNLLAAAMKV